MTHTHTHTKPTPPSIATGRFANSYRSEIIMHLLERDGNLCQGHKNHFLNNLYKIRIDHIDGHTDHNCLLNFRLVCHSFNVVPRSSLTCACVCGYGQSKQAEIKEKDGAFYIESPVIARILDDIAAGKDTEPTLLKELANEIKSQEAAKDEQTLTAAMRKNKRVEGPFNVWLNNLVHHGILLGYLDWSNAGAFAFDCSQETIKRYLDKRLNPYNGDLFIDNGASGHDVIRFRAK